MRFKINWDALGIAASVACAIHCAVLPIFISSLSLLGVNIIENYLFEFGMIGLAFVVGSYSLYHGLKKHHHSKVPMVIFICGMLALLAKEFWHNQAIWFLIPAVLFIVSAHYLNFRYCRKHAHAHEDDCDH